MAPTYFIQGCPTCGRRCQIRVEHLGKRVVCYHCKAQFIAVDPASEPAEGTLQDVRLDDELGTLCAMHFYLFPDDGQKASSRPESQVNAGD
ncbi:MAG: hypothetical protein D6741_22065 [Planctomycetota bacterium]|nr:MAG: hypothetical protein D6741_22065 [Planctomycetota bacterium]